jgi:V8-like Glu-specific endopeptidase
MNRKSKLTVVFVVVALMMLAVALGVQAAEPQPITTPLAIDPPLSAGVLAEPASLEAQAAALNYWTRDNMEAAQPIVLMVDPSTAAVDTAAAPAGPAALDLLEASPAGRPSPDADAIARQAYAADWAELEAAVLDVAAADAAAAAADAAIDAGMDAIDSPTGTSQIFTRYWGNLFTQFWTGFPYRAVGKLFSSGGSCTASSISNSRMVTAAHCVYNTGSNTWYANKVFVPAYRNGAAPYGQFPTNGCYVLTAWVNLSGGYSINSWARHDVAVCRMSNNSAGQTLNAAVGWLGRSSNPYYIQNYHNFGYASNISSLYTSICTAESFYQTTNTRGMGCDMTYGASGGPWILGFAPFQSGANNYVAGVNSGIFIGVQNIYGPQFTANNIGILCNATYAAC